MAKTADRLRRDVRAFAKQALDELIARGDEFKGISFLERYEDVWDQIWPLL